MATVLSGGVVFVMFLTHTFTSLYYRMACLSFLRGGIAVFYVVYKARFIFDGGGPLSQENWLSDETPRTIVFWFLLAVVLFILGVVGNFPLPLPFPGKDSLSISLFFAVVGFFLSYPVSLMLALESLC